MDKSTYKIHSVLTVLMMASFATNNAFAVNHNQTADVSQTDIPGINLATSSTNEESKVTNSATLTIDGIYNVATGIYFEDHNVSTITTITNNGNINLAPESSTGGSGNHYQGFGTDQKIHH